MPSEFRQALDAPLRRFFLGIFTSCVAVGLTISLYVVYLHNALRFSINFATLLLAVSSLVGLLASAVWGSLTDRYGPVAILVLASACDAATLVAWAYIRSERSAVIAGIILAFFGGAAWGPGSTLLARLVAPEHRQRAYGVNFMLVNLGVGLGGLISAAVVDLHHPLTFRWLYLGNATVSLVAGGVFASLWSRARSTAGESTGDRDASASPDSATSGSWRDVARDRRLVLLVAASVVLMLGGYGAIDAGLSLFVVNNLHLSLHVIGVFLFLDTITIVLAQLVAIKFVEGRSRTRVLAVVGLLWSTFWIALAITLALPTPAVIVTIAAAIVVFAVGETLISPLGPALVNEIAPEHLRGRYNAANGLSWSVAGTVAPTITAVFFDNGLSNWWPLSASVFSLLGGAMMLNLRHHLSASEDGRSTN